MLSTEQLLQPRVLLTGPYPEMERHNLRVGDIITVSDTAMIADKTQDGTPVVAIDHEIFPNLFRRLKWWEFRDEKDMPEYVKLNPENCIIEEVEKGEVFKVWSIKIFDDGIGLKIYPPAEKDPANPMMEYMHLKYLLPATAEEYEQFTHPAPLGDKQ